jgi:hypothetical protein
MGGKRRCQKEKEYEVDRIVGYCADKNMYRVRWKGYLEDEDTWEPFQHLNEAAQIDAVAYKQTWENKRVKMPEHAKEVCEAESTRYECVAERTEPEAESCNYEKDVPSSYVIKTTFSQQTGPEAEEYNHEKELHNSYVQKTTFSHYSHNTNRSVSGGLEEHGDLSGDHQDAANDAFLTKCEIVWGIKPTQLKALPLGMTPKPLCSWDADINPNSCWDDSTVGDVAPCEFDYSVTPEFDDKHVFDDYSAQSYDSQISIEKRRSQPTSDTNPEAPHDLIDLSQSICPTKMNHPRLHLKKFDPDSDSTSALDPICYGAYSNVCSLFPDKGSFDPCQKEHAMKLVEKLFLLRLSPRLKEQITREHIRLYLRSQIATIRGNGMLEYNIISGLIGQRDMLIANGCYLASDTERIESGEIKQYDSEISHDCRTQYRVKEIFAEIDKIYREQCSLTELCDIAFVTSTWLHWAAARALDVVRDDKELNLLLEVRLKDWEVIGHNRSCIGLEFDKLWLLHGHSSYGEGCSIEFYIQTLASNFSIPHTNSVLRDLVQARFRMWAARRHLSQETRATIVRNSTLAWTHWKNLRELCKLNNKKKEELYDMRVGVRERKLAFLASIGMREDAYQAIKDKPEDDESEGMKRCLLSYKMGYI